MLKRKWLLKDSPNKGKKVSFHLLILYSILLYSYKFVYYFFICLFHVPHISFLTFKINRMIFLFLFSNKILSTMLVVSKLINYSFQLLRNPVCISNKQDILCKAVMGAATSVGGNQFFLQHSGLYSCCSHCSGEMQVI